ncbi:IclR family transcriptional regulator [Nocardia mexicana]|uniref:Glycerol operon regulatory protein n=1 Tax=Nocardia mexicana TaxID=279262 RepID=A0A370HHG2_9NOCA|nr:IclR family transcriptional regulator [Nocardia mexicana]
MVGMPTDEGRIAVTEASPRTGGVQSVDRAFELLELVADAGGEATLSQLAEASGLPQPTIHRLLRTLITGGYIRQQPSRRYSLGPRLIRLGETAGRVLGASARPHLTRLRDLTGETSNMAVLDGDQVVYVAQVPSPHAMRMFTEVGQRVDLHCTAVGKAVLATLAPEESDRILSRISMSPRTTHTITDPSVMRTEVDRIRIQGYAVDDGEQEIGVRCFAVAIPNAPTRAAISISGPQARVSGLDMDAIIPLLQETAANLGKDLTAQS